MKDNPGKESVSKTGIDRGELTYVSRIAHHGLLRMLSYILQAMSADREFGMALNKPLDITIPVKWNVQGTTADFMVVVSVSVQVSFLALWLTGRISPVHVLHCDHAWPQSSVPGVDCDHQQRSAIPERSRHPGFDPLTPAFQSILGPQLFVGR